MKHATILALLIGLAAAGLFSSEAFGRRRYVDPNTGRFTQRDPLDYADGNNLYANRKNNPGNGRDPDGRLTILIHGIDNTNWYARAAAAIKAVKPKEKVVKFTWGFHRPRTEMTFGKDFVLVDSLYFHNVFPRYFKFKNPEIREAERMTKLFLRGEQEGNRRLTNQNRKEALKGVNEQEKAMIKAGHDKKLIKRLADAERARIEKLFDHKPGNFFKTESDYGGAKVKVTFTKRGLKALEPFPPAGKSINLWVGGLFKNRESQAAAKLKTLLVKLNSREAARKRCEPIRILAFSSGARVLSAALPTASWWMADLDRVVLVGASVSKDDRRIAAQSKVVYNYYSDADFITRYVPREGGAGSFPMTGEGVQNRSVPGVFHGDWMKGKLMDRFVNDLIPKNEQNPKKK